jgi:quinol monooxygenase YgiN
MSISLLAALAGTVAALGGLVLLIRLCTRTPRMDMIAWVVAMAGLAIALAVQAAGFQRGFGPTTFRAAQLGVALITPLALAWGMAELAAKGLAARFAARLCLAGLFVVASVILATDVLSSQPFSQAWPTARMHFEFLPLALLALTAVVSVLIAVVALATVGLRTRQDSRWRRALPAVAAAGVAVLAVQGLQASLPNNAAYPGLSIVIVVLAALAGERASRVPLDAMRGAPGRADGPGWQPAGRPGYAADDSLGLYADGYRRHDDTGGFSADPYRASGHAGYPGREYADTGGFGPATGDFQTGDMAGYEAGQYPHTGQFSSYPAGEFSGHHGGAAPEPVTGAFDALYREGSGAGRHPDPAAGPAAADGPGSGAEPVTGMQLAALEEAVLEKAAQDGAVPGAALDDAAGDAPLDTEHLYGQIAIYTLLEAGAAEFDRLADHVLEEVAAAEPDTLVYVVHDVPSAPLQRILYQVYRDRAAYDEHLRQPYVADFDARLRPLVLATNVIELGVQQAKVTALTRHPERGVVAGRGASAAPGRAAGAGTGRGAEAATRRAGQAP